MSFTRFITRLAAPAPKPEQFGRVLFIGPHPDDIEIGCGATAARFAAEGKQVCYLVCIDGRYGDEYASCGLTPELQKELGVEVSADELPGYKVTAEQLIAIRRRETINAAAAAGVSDVRFLNLSDGGFYTEEELLTGIARVIGDFKPEIIFSIDPDVISECHADHINVGRAVKKLAFFAPFAKIMARYGAEAAPVQAIAMYMTAKPNRYVKTKGYFKKQVAILSTCFPSQYPKENPALSSVLLYLKLRAYEFGLRRFSGTAEGFRVLGVTHMHCMPEAGE